MSTNPSPSATHHDRLVKERLPRWLSDLKPQQIARLRHLDDFANCTWVQAAPKDLRAALDQALLRNRAVTFALARAMKDLRSVADFAEPLLTRRLHERFGLEGDLRDMHFVRFSRDWNWSILATELTHRVEPLLQAALQNFEQEPLLQPESVAVLGEFRVGSFNGYERYHFHPLPFSAAQFAEQCHALDLGQRYQDHLNQVFGRQDVRDLAISARREQFQLDLVIARIRGLQDDHEPLQRLLDEANGKDRPGCEHFSLFGVDVLDAVLIRPVADAQAVVLYLPGMPVALARYATLDACERDLLRQLCDPALRQRFYGFIQQDKVEHFASVLQRNLTGQTLPAERDAQWTVPAHADLHFNGSVIDDELFGYLQDRHHRRLLNEARLLAVPSAAVDEAARQRRLRDWESAGLDLLGVAAFFVPAAGSLMMVVFAAQILGEVYEGVEAWEQGDIDAALGHAKAVALDLATAVATGVTLHYAGKLSRNLIEVIRPDATPRLWNGDLKPYRVEPDQHLAAGRRSVRLGDDHFAAAPHTDGQRWRILHPDNPEAFQPLLEHNGEGAWHAAHEHPLAWSRQTLLRRLGEKVADYRDDELDIASRISAVTRDDLLAVYLKHAPIPPRLLQTLHRVRAGVPADDPLEALYEGIYRPERGSPASERLVLTSLPHRQDWPADCTVELRNGDRAGPLLERAGDRFALDNRLILKVPGGYRAVLGAEPQALVQDLFAALHQAVPELDGDTQALKNALVEQAQHNPGRTRGLVWSGHSGGWRDEGRLLGGFDGLPPQAFYPPTRAGGHTLLARYRRLYPGMSDEQARATLDGWSNDGLQPHLQVRTLERQLEYLRTSLGQWAADAPLRTVARDALIRCWQRNQARSTELDLSAIGLDDNDFATLPHLGGAFDHVEELNVSSNPLRSIPYLLTQQLSRLHTLWASALELRHLPAGLGSGLRMLELTDNAISWSSISQEALAQYPNLEHLNLSGNPLHSAPDLTAAANLRDVSLFDCSLTQVPDDLGDLAHLEHLDLSSNLITRLPVGLEQDLPAATQRALSLEHNPLDEETMNRIDAHYQLTGIDLIVAEDDYTTLLLNADEATLACWERLSRLIPVEYRRDLRHVADEPVYGAAPTTTRRRFWFMLPWLESSPRARTLAQRIDASQLLNHELLADLDRSEPFTTPRLKSEHYLKVAVNSARCLALDEALRVRLPNVNAAQLEALRALTLQRLGNDPQLRMRFAPTAREPVNLDTVEREALQLDGNWTGVVRHQLRLIDGISPVGRDAILAEGADGEPVLSFWVKHLEQRYHAEFEQLQEQANAQLLDAESLLSEGEYLHEANHLRRQLDRERHRLLDDLTRGIAMGNPPRW
ncbi:dermonecrotic toxin domain-containing protein [Pseudomonas wadenswilerensis]